MLDPAKLGTFIAKRNWPAAELVLRQMAAQDGAPASVFYNLAKVLEMQQKHGERVAHLREAVRRQAQYGAAWFELGRALIAEQDWPEAEAAFAQAALQDPDDQEIWRSLARLRLRLGDWSGCRVALSRLPEDAETKIMHYRTAAELGEDTSHLRAQLLADKSLRPGAIKALTRVAKGSLPLRFPQAR